MAVRASDATSFTRCDRDVKCGSQLDVGLPESEFDNKDKLGAIDFCIPTRSPAFKLLERFFTVIDDDKHIPEADSGPWRLDAALDALYLHNVLDLRSAGLSAVGSLL